jgi:hypothetical protein
MRGIICTICVVLHPLTGAQPCPSS